jgi:hypothetical protein
MLVEALYSIHAHRNSDFLTTTFTSIFVNNQIVLIQINVLPKSVLFALDQYLEMVYVTGACLKPTFTW